MFKAKRQSPNDVFIAVMGVTGSGKSSFISLCSGKSVSIGHSLESCTSTVDIYAYDVSPERTVYLIDTPGFDDTTKSDTDVLSEIAAWLVDSYRNKILLHGIIYLHRITDNRMQGSAKRNFLMFKQLCGPDALKHVILATTMWDRVPDGDGVDREKVLVDTPEFWGWMLARGSSCHRHDNTEASARAIVGLLVDHDGPPVATDLQRQLVDEHRPLDQTSAGRELHSEMLREKEKWERERREMERQMLVAVQQRDRETERLLREERDSYTRKISKVEGDTEKLRSTMEKLLADRDERVALVERELERQKAAYEGELRRFQERAQQLKEERDGLEKERALAELGALQQVQLRRGERAENTRLSGYSISMYGSARVCLSPSYTAVATPNGCPEITFGSAKLVAASVGDSSITGAAAWIARYSDGTWRRSANLETQYPYLGENIRTHGLQALEYCALGPGPRHYARWKNGAKSCNATDQVRGLLRNCKRDAAKTGSKIVAVAFGYGDACVISYGCLRRPETLVSCWNLFGYYPDLERFLRENSAVRIVAIALDPSSTTDYIMVYYTTEPDGRGGYGLVSNCSESDDAALDKWWNTTCGLST
ncbi:hypothetical protein C8A01DRAFT_46258 [Parachaetomium inaequale]|uniref:G domain-containing protein n=1 Tax=Parachaetomium inaequale TaxID=2588326 RepID=A0AAN6PGD1_9PEZI|nr:hypothetical protein C8A01DRAFT_46258 [Parachaetomium inaequale]